MPGIVGKYGFTVETLNPARTVAALKQCKKTLYNFGPSGGVCSAASPARVTVQIATRGRKRPAHAVAFLLPGRIE
jgi:hypothetical protein